MIMKRKEADIRKSILIVGTFFTKIVDFVMVRMHFIKEAGRNGEKKVRKSRGGEGKNVK